MTHVRQALLIAVFQALLSTPISLLLGFLYTSQLDIPIEGLTVIQFCFEAAITTLFAGFFLTWAALSILDRATIWSARRQFIVTITAATMGLIVSLSVLFPCLPAPYFVGGYILRRLLH